MKHFAQVLFCMAATFHFDPSNWLEGSSKSYITLTLAQWNLVFSTCTDVCCQIYWFMVHMPCLKTSRYTFITLTLQFCCIFFYLQRYKLYVQNQFNSVSIQVQHNSFKAKKLESPCLTINNIHISWYGTSFCTGSDWFTRSREQETGREDGCTKKG